MPFKSIARDFEIREGNDMIEIMNVERCISDYHKEADLDLVLTWWQRIELKLIWIKMKLFY
jgi:hypothetical protein